MKQFIVTIMGLLVVLSCGQKSRSSVDDDDEEDEEVVNGESGNSITTKTFTYNFEEGKIEVGLEVDYPTKGNKALCNAVREYISEKLGGNYDQELDANGQKVIDFYGDAIKQDLADNLNEQRQDMEEDYINGFYHHFNIKKDYETDQLVTFMFSEDIYLNGAHGMQYCYGQTFRKSDGRRFDKSMMTNLSSDQMYKLTKEGLIEYFSQGDTSISTDEDLKEYILTEDDVNYLPLPNQDPYVTSEGMVFIYQPYEISFYAAGMPEFTVPIDKMKPFLTNTAKQMLGIE